jgi:hypothetical protein
VHGAQPIRAVEIVKIVARVRRRFLLMLEGDHGAG